MSWWYKCLHELTTQVSLCGCPVLMLFSYIQYWPVSRSEKRMHWVLAWCRMAPIMFIAHMHLKAETTILWHPCTAPGIIQTWQSTAVFPTESIQSWTTDTSGILDHMWEQCKYQPRDMACDTRSAKENLISSTDSTNVMMDLKGKTWILRLDLSNPAENLQPSSALGIVWKCWYYCRILISVSRHCQVAFWCKQQYTLLQTNVACDGPHQHLRNLAVLMFWVSEFCPSGLYLTTG